MNLVIVGFLFVSIAIIYGDTDAAWRQAALDKHNEYRKRHGAPPLINSPDLCDMSQKWAEHLKSLEGDEKLVHSGVRGFGENLFWSMSGGSGSADAKLGPDIAVKDWYDEIKEYDFATGKSPTGGVVGHFTQVVWKGSKEVCTSYAKKAEANSVEFFVVANYRPAGNFIGKYIANVAGRGASKKGTQDGGKANEKPEGNTNAITITTDNMMNHNNETSQGSRKESQRWHSFSWISLLISSMYD